MNRRVLVLLLVVFLSATSILAQSFQGNWKGVVKTPYMDLPIVAHFVKDGKVWVGTLDSPEQNSYDIPADTVAVYGDSIYFTIDKLRVEYRGRLQHKDTVSGVFKQGKRSQNITFVRAGNKVKSAYLQGFKTKELLIKNEDAKITIAGTLTYPQKGRNFPTVIIVGGSGPQDRDWNILGQKPFKVMAEKLTRSGFAVFRYDERGVGKSTGVFSKSTTKDFTSDVESIFLALQKERKLAKDKIGVLGHSEGSIIAAMVAAKNKELAFAISMGGPGMSFDTLMLLQYRKLAEAAGEDEKDIVTSLKLNKDVFNAALTYSDSSALAHQISDLVSAKIIMDSLNVSEDSMLSLINSNFTAYNTQINNLWWRYILSVNPLDYWSKVQCPVYILNGYLDLQVPSSPNVLNIENTLNRNGNLDTYKKGYPGLNHLFQKAKTGAVEEYISGNMIFTSVVQNDIVNWLNGLWVE